MADNIEPVGDRVSFLTSSEKMALVGYAPALRANVLMSLHGMLRALGIEDKGVIETSVATMREASAKSSLLELESALGAMHALQSHLHKAEPAETTPRTISASIIETEAAATPELPAGVAEPVPSDRVKLPANVTRIFEFLDEEHRAVLAALDEGQTAAFVSRLTEIFRGASSKPQYTDIQMQRLGLFLKGYGAEEVAEAAGGTSSAAYQGTLSMSKIFSRVQGDVLTALQEAAGMGVTDAAGEMQAFAEQLPASGSENIVEVEAMSFERRAREVVYEFCDSLGMSRAVKKLLYMRLHDNPQCVLYGPELRQRMPQVTYKYTDALQAYPDLLTDLEKAITRSALLPDMSSRQAAPMCIRDIQGKYRRELEESGTTAAECVIVALEKINAAYAESAA